MVILTLDDKSFSGWEKWIDEKGRIRMQKGEDFIGHYDEVGRRHKEDGPALITDGKKSWYYHGKSMMCSSQEEFEKLLKLKAFW